MPDTIETRYSPLAPQDMLDELLESIDLSTYGLARTKLNHTVELDPADSELDPQNPNPRGYRDGESERDPLDEIIRRADEIEKPKHLRKRFTAAY